MTVIATGNRSRVATSKGIRPLERSDLPRVADLYEHVMRSGERHAPPAMAAYFERIFFDHPWVDPEIPSLVYEDMEGNIVGFIGSHVRRFLFDGEPIRVGVCGQLIADPAVRSQAVGAFLMRKYMTGPQELSLMETCSDGMRLMWESLGGKTVHLNSLMYTRVFRPWRYAAGKLPAALRVAAGPLASGLDGLSRRVPRNPFRVPEGDRSEEPPSPAALLEHLPDIAGSRRLVPAYDEPFLRWLFDEMAAVKSRGDLAGSLVRDKNAKVIGWHLYHGQAGGKGLVIQVEAKHGRTEEVLKHLFAHAQGRGVTILHGRIEPKLHIPIVAEGRSILHSLWDRTLIHSRNPELLQAYYTGDAMFTRMEGEVWMGFHLEPFA